MHIPGFRLSGGAKENIGSATETMGKVITTLGAGAIGTCAYEIGKVGMATTKTEWGIEGIGGAVGLIALFGGMGLQGRGARSEQEGHVLRQNER